MANGQFITKRKLAEILEKKPENISAEDIVSELANSGNEIEGFNAEFSPLSAVQNIPGSLVEFGKSIWAAVSNPVQTADSIADVVKGGVLSALPDDILKKEKSQEIGELRNKFGAVVDFFSDRYGSKERLLETIERDPAGFLGDASTFFTAGAGVAGKVPLLNKISKPLKVASSNIDPIRLVTKAGSGAVNAAKTTNKALGVDKWFAKKAGEFGTKGLGLKPSEVRDLGLKTFGDNAGQVLAEWGVRGDLEQISSQLDNIWKKSKTLVDDTLDKIPDKFRARQIDVGLKSAIRTLKNVQSRELLKKRRDLNSLLAAHSGKNSTGLTLSEINEVKRSLDDVFDVFKKSGQAKDQLRAKDIANVRSDINSFIEAKAIAAGAPSIKALNKQTQFARGLRELISRNDLESFAKSRGFIDRMIIAGGAVGAITYLNPTLLAGAAGVVGIEKFMRSTQFRSLMATKLMTMSGAKRRALLGAIETGKPTRQSVKVFREVMSSMKEFFPEIRMAGVITEKEFEEQKRLTK